MKPSYETEVSIEARQEGLQKRFSLPVKVLFILLMKNKRDKSLWIRKVGNVNGRLGESLLWRSLLNGASIVDALLMFEDEKPT
jgi:hypothetical protein